MIRPLYHGYPRVTPRPHDLPAHYTEQAYAAVMAERDRMAVAVLDLIPVADDQGRVSLELIGAWARELGIRVD